MSIPPALVRRHNRRKAMKFMMLVKATKESEAGALPDDKMLSEMARYNEQLAKAGMLVDLAGLQPTSKGARVKFAGGKTTVIDGPSAEAKELVAGYWVIQAKSKQEAIEWARRVPAQDGEIEIRQVFELEDFPPGEGVEHHRKIEKMLKRDA
jgi:hypothetical protein